MLESLIGHGINCQGKDYEIVGATGGDAYHFGGPTVFDVFDLTDYTFYELKHDSIVGNRIVNTYSAQGVFKLRSGFLQNNTSENTEQGSTLKVRPTEPFVELLGTNREFWQLTLQPTDFSDWEES